MTFPRDKQPIPVDEIDAITRDEFLAEYVTRHRPLIIRAAIAHWQTMQWTDRYLVDAVGDYSLKVDITPHPNSPDRGGAIQSRRMTIAQFVDRYRTGEDSYYILDQNLCPGLHTDLGHHPVCEAFPITRRKTLFWGHGEQVYATEQFSGFDDATLYVAELRKGDVLYVPCYWWHDVRSYERHLAVSYIIHETLDQRLRVTRKLIEQDAVAIAPAVKAELRAILASAERPAAIRKQLKAYHARYRHATGHSFYPHAIFERLIEENLFQVLYGHQTY